MGFPIDGNFNKAFIMTFTGPTEGGGVARTNAGASAPSVFGAGFGGGAVEQPKTTEETQQPKQNQSAQLGDKPTPEEVQGFMNSDPRIAKLQASLPELKAKAEDLEKQFEESRKNFSSFLDGGVSMIDVRQAQDNYKNAQKILNSYRNMVENWKDGEVSKLTTGDLAGSDMVKCTLPNGQKGYKIETFENGQKVEYYFNTSLQSSLPGKVVDKKVIE